MVRGMSVNKSIGTSWDDAAASVKYTLSLNTNSYNKGLSNVIYNVEVRE